LLRQNAPRNDITAELNSSGSVKNRIANITFDFVRQMEGAIKVKTSELATAIIGNM